MLKELAHVEDTADRPIAASPFQASSNVPAGTNLDVVPSK